MKKLLALLLALVMVLSLAACGGNGNGADDDDDGDSVTLPSIGGVTIPSIDGVTIPSIDGVTIPSIDGVTLPGMEEGEPPFDVATLTARRPDGELGEFNEGGLIYYADTAWETSGNGYFYSDEMDMQTNDLMPEQYDQTFAGGEDFARYLAQDEITYDYIEVFQYDGIWCVLHMQTSQDYGKITGCYVEADKYWSIMVHGYGFSQIVEEALWYVTNGRVDPHRNDPQLPPEQVRQDGTLGGMKYQVDESFTLKKEYSTYLNYRNDDDMSVEILFGRVDQLGVSSAEDMANYLIQEEFMGETEDIRFDSANGVYYYSFEPGYTDSGNVCGCYVSGDYGWLIKVRYDDREDQLEKAVGIATSGQIQPDQIPQTDVPIRHFQTEHEGLSLVVHYYMNESVKNGKMTLTCELGTIYITTGNSGGTAAALLEQYRQALPEDRGDVEIGQRNGVGYVSSCDDYYGWLFVASYYVEGDTWWLVEREGDGYFVDLEQMIDSVTSAVVK
ncbi:MAG: hypothetical protein IJV82_00025 [Oscillospiraceae bacterium]|nr:hypothetical protein [Oscillospiraceae bacterium]